ncbi:hypothetical protein ACER0A_013960 [Haloimpatiens sp. FM7315]|uniref:hypothetical protein n=1 Tax=Haloimpatiens sp. FM7315 TaxID=3298609 RepID=UPI0035A3217A
MKYEIVALFDDVSENHMDYILNKVCRRYKLNKNTYNTYVHLNTIYDVKLEELDPIITKVLKPYKKFKVQLDNDVFVDSNNKFINLKIENKGYINRIARNISDLLNLSGFSTKPNNTPLYVPLTNTINNRKNYYLRNNNFESLDASIKEASFKITRIEVWKGHVNNKKDFSVKKYELRDY